MTTITVHIDKEQDLTEVSSVLNRLGLDYEVSDNSPNDLSAVEMQAINAGLKDIEQGRVFTNAEVVDRVSKRLEVLRAGK